MSLIKATLDQKTCVKIILKVFMVQKLRIKNCPHGSEGRLKQLTCPKLWDALEPTDTERVRFCSSCERDVHHVITDEEIGRAIREDHCIAWEVPTEIREKYGKPVFMGWPDSPAGPMSRNLLTEDA